MQLYYESRQEKEGMDMEEQLQRVKDLSVRKGKRGVMQLVFGRTGILLACLLVQLLLLFLGIQFVAQYVYLLFGGHLAFGFLILVLIVNRNENPAFPLAWASLVLLFPVFGGLLYLYIELQPGTRLMAAQLAEIERETKGLLRQDPEVMRKLEQTDRRTAQLVNYVMQRQGYPVCRNTETTYFPGGEQMFEELKKQLRLAEHFIFLEYFILEEGEMWDSIEDILAERAEAGVEVRVMYDGMNELSNLPHGFGKRIRGRGIRCRVFSPVYPVISTHYNNRDHRKIAVIDGHTAFTGGVNLADEYINRRQRFGHWKDAAVMLRGGAAESFTLMFLKMWDLTEKTENYSFYLRKSKTASKGEGFVLPYTTNPFTDQETSERVFIELLNGAVSYVHIMTPYLIPDHELLQAMTYAAQRGIDVKLILPHIPDKRYAFALAHSYYRRLRKAGVRIYEYTPGFVHSKVFISDGIRAVVGAINLDYRSLYLNFECAAFFYRVPEIAEMEADFRATLPKCRLITEYDIRHDPLTRKAAGRILKIMAPLM